MDDGVFRVSWMNLLSEFMGIRESEIIFKTLLFHVETAVLLEQINIHGVFVLLDLALLAACKYLTGTYK